MNKFAFKTSDEKSLLMVAVRRHVPANIFEQFSKFAAGIATLPPRTMTPNVPAISEAVKEELAKLREMLEDFLSQVNIDFRKPQASQWIGKILEDIGLPLQIALRGRPSARERLESHPTATKEIEAFNPEEMAGEPTVVPREQKISPGGKQPNMWRKPTAQVESWSLSKTATKDGFEFNHLVGSVLEIADLADEAGMLKEADTLASVLPALRTVKVAQYEGFQNYWIANGRAFEMAYKQKRSKGKTKVEDFRSPHEVWWEILEEYQNSLLSNQGDFISRYAGKDYSNLDKAASEILLEKINTKVEKGASPGVALYESIDELSNGEHSQIVAKRFSEALSIITQAAKKDNNEALLAKVDAIIKEAGMWDTIKSFFSPNEPKTTVELVKRLEEEKQRVVGRLRGLYTPKPNYQEVPTGEKNFLGNPKKVKKEIGTYPLPPIYESNVQWAVGSLLLGLKEYADRLKLLGMTPPPIPSIEQIKKRDDGSLDMASVRDFSRQFDAAIEQIRPQMAQQVDMHLKKMYPEVLEGLTAEQAAVKKQEKPAEPAPEVTTNTSIPSEVAKNPLDVNDLVENIIKLSEEPDAKLANEQANNLWENWRKLIMEEATKRKHSRKQQSPENYYAPSFAKNKKGTDIKKG